MPLAAERYGSFSGEIPVAQRRGHAAMQLSLQLPVVAASPRSLHPRELHPRESHPRGFCNPATCSCSLSGLQLQRAVRAQRKHIRYIHWHGSTRSIRGRL